MNCEQSLTLARPLGLCPPKGHTPPQPGSRDTLTSSPSMACMPVAPASPLWPWEPVLGLEGKVFSSPTLLDAVSPLPPGPAPAPLWAAFSDREPAVGHADLATKGWESWKDRARNSLLPTHISLSTSLQGISGGNTRERGYPTSARFGAHELANKKQRRTHAGLE